MLFVVLLEPRTGITLQGIAQPCGVSVVLHTRRHSIVGRHSPAHPKPTIHPLHGLLEVKNNKWARALLHSARGINMSCMLWMSCVSNMAPPQPPSTWVMSEHNIWSF